jgi:MYXO-CTERM domain-containing protein
VSGGFFVFAPPYNHAPRFQTEPPTAAPIGIVYSYDADAIDLNVDDTITFSLEASPPGMTVDPATGVVEYTPPADAPAFLDVALIASDEKGAVSVQAFTLVTDGSTGEGGAAGGSATGGTGGFGGGDIGEEGGFGPTSGPGGYGGEGEGGFLDDNPIGPRRCSCRIPGEDGGAGTALALLIALGAIRGRRSRRKGQRLQ